MRILFLNTLDDPSDGGGAEVTLWTLMRALTEAGHQCVVLATSEGHGLKSSEREGVKVWRAGIRNVYWPGKKSRPSAPARLVWHTIDSYNVLMQGFLEQVLAIESPDVVSIHNLPGWSAVAWDVIRRAGIPSVQVLHDQYALCPKSAMFNKGRNCEKQCISCRMLRLPHRALSNGVSAVVGVSQFILDRHLHYGCFQEVTRRHVIHNARQPGPLGLDTPDVVHAGLRIGFIGRLDPTKGVEKLLEAFGNYRRPDAELLIAGNGKPDYEAALIAQAVDPRVRFLGRVKPSEFYPQIDVVVVPSLWNDTFPGVVFESLAFGKPVIGSRRGGIAEMIRDDYNGLLFEPDHPGELTDALQRLGDNDELRTRLGRAAFDSGRPFLDIDAWVARYTDLYSELSKPSRALPEEA